MKWMMIMIECILVCSKDMGSSIVSATNEVSRCHWKGLGCLSCRSLLIDCLFSAWN
jgi:hypothetical protein